MKNLTAENKTFYIIVGNFEAVIYVDSDILVSQNTDSKIA